MIDITCQGGETAWDRTWGSASDSEPFSLNSPLYFYLSGQSAGLGIVPGLSPHISKGSAPLPGVHSELPCEDKWAQNLCQSCGLFHTASRK